MKRTLITFAILAAAVGTSGCLATLDGKLENALAPSLACDKTFIVSEYFNWGITSRLRQADHEKIREKFCPPAAPAAK